MLSASLSPISGLTFASPEGELQISSYSFVGEEDECELCGEEFANGDYVVESEPNEFVHVSCLRDDNSRGSEIVNVTTL